VRISELAADGNSYATTSSKAAGMRRRRPVSPGIRRHCSFGRREQETGERPSRLKERLAHRRIDEIIARDLQSDRRVGSIPISAIWLTHTAFRQKAGP